MIFDMAFFLKSNVVLLFLLLIPIDFYIRMLNKAVRCFSKPTQIIAIILIQLVICTEIKAQDSKPAEEGTALKRARFAIYLVKHLHSEPYNPWLSEKAAVNDLELDEKPILTEEDIDSYRISPEGRHFIKLKPDVKVRILPIPGGVVLDQGFVVVADGARIYLGDFNSLISSHLPTVPVVGIPMARPGSLVELDTDIEIRPIPIRGTAKDLRYDPRILEVLKDLGKLDRKQDPEGWGESFQSVKVRLTADRPTWRQADEPSFRVEILNGGNHEIMIPTGPNACRGLDLDGIFYESASVPLSSLAPGGHYHNIIVLKSGIWRSQGKPIDLKPGKHAIRVVYDSIESQWGPLRLISNPVEIQVLPADSKK